MGVDHGGADVFVTEEFLDGADVIAGLEKVGGERVAEGVTGDALGQADFLSSPTDGALQGRGIEVMAAFFPLAAGIG